MPVVLRSLFAPCHLPGLDPNIILRSSITRLVPGIENASWLDEQQLDFAVGKWLVLDSLRDHEHLAGGEGYGAVPEVDAELAVEDDERLVKSPSSRTTLNW